MNIHRRGMSTAILAALLVAVSGCHSSAPANSASNNQPAAAAGTQAAPAADSQPETSNGSPAPDRSAYRPEPSAPQPPPPPAAVDLPTGTTLRVRLDQDLGSKISQPGDVFSATVNDAVVVQGTQVIPKGARAEGTVIDAKPLGRFKGGARLVVRLDRVHTRWGTYPVATSSVARVERGKGKRTAIFAGGGGALGALIGGLTGGGKGAAIGALAGAGAGTAGDAFTGNRQIVLPAETILTFRLEHSVHVVEGQ